MRMIENASIAKLLQTICIHHVRHWADDAEAAIALCLDCVDVVINVSNPTAALQDTPGEYFLRSNCSALPYMDFFRCEAVNLEQQLWPNS